MAGGAAPAAPPQVTQLLDTLLAEAQASVRPPTEDEGRDAAEQAEAAGEEPPVGLTHAMQVRQAAEALLVVAERLNRPEVRRRAGKHWAALAGHLDARLTQALYASLDEDDDWGGSDHSILWSRILERPSTQALKVASSFGSAGLMGQVGGMDMLAAFLGGMGGQLAAQLALVRSRMTSQASTRRPPLASKLARFDASYQPAAGGGTQGAAVAEARCEVSCTEAPAFAGLAVGGDCVAVTGGCEYRGRSCYLAIGRASGEGPWQRRLLKVPSGFYDPGCRIVADPARDLVWAGGEEPRIKAFAVGSSGREACRYTLASSKEGLLGVFGGRVLSAAGKGRLQYWDIGRLTPQRQWIEAGALEQPRSPFRSQENEEPQSKRRNMWGCKTLNLLASTSNENASEEAEATAGDEPHGTIQLLGPELGSGQHRDKIEQLLPLGALQGDAQPQQVAARLEHSNSLFVFDWQDSTPALHTLLAGHTGNVTAAAASATLPHMLASGSYDGTLRVWDLRTAACTHVLASKSEGPVPAVALVEDQGAPFCFWSNHQSEAILCFDLRMRRCLYELATGNTDVHDLQWHAPSRSLFAQASSRYDSSDYRNVDGCRWPRAMHRPSDFPCAWDAGQGSIIVRYQFKDSPDLGLLPPGAQLYSQAAEEGSEGDDSSEWETMASDEEWSEEQE